MPNYLKLYFLLTKDRQQSYLPKKYYHHQIKPNFKTNSKTCHKMFKTYRWHKKTSVE